MYNPLGGQKVGFGPGTRVDQVGPFEPRLQVGDTVEYPSGITIVDDAEDSGHTGKETILRAGLALVRIETGDDKGKFVPAAHADAPAAEDVQEAVILLETLNMEGKEGAVEEKIGVPAMIGGTVADARIFYDDAAYKDAIQAALPRVSFLTVPV